MEPEGSFLTSFFIQMEFEFLRKRSPSFGMHDLSPTTNSSNPTGQIIANHHTCQPHIS